MVCRRRYGRLPMAAVRKRKWPWFVWRLAAEVGSVFFIISSYVVKIDRIDHTTVTDHEPWPTTGAATEGKAVIFFNQNSGLTSGEWYQAI